MFILVKTKVIIVNKNDETKTRIKITFLFTRNDLKQVKIRNDN